MDTAAARFRIGELSRRSGVSIELLRAWETRYGLVAPLRSPGGFRLYSERDETRVRRMQALLREGASAAEAARGALAEDARGRRATVPDGLIRRLDTALLAFDEPAAHDALDGLFASVELTVAIEEGILPLLRSIGARWAAGEITVAQEHFGSALLRGRLLTLARGWDRGRGPRAVLACAPGELHDIGLIAFGILLHQDGWRILYLGQDTPIDTAVATVRRTRARALVVVAIDPARFRALGRGAAGLPRGAVMAVGGGGATAAVARQLRARLIGPDLAAGVRQLEARGASAPPPR